MEPPAPIDASPEHPAPDPVPAENVPIFCRKFRIYMIGRAAIATAISIEKTIRFMALAVKVCRRNGDARRVDS